MVITDGRSTRGINSLRAPVKQLKDSSINFVSIGVGSKINRQELQIMASDPVNSHVFYVSNMNQLQTLVGTITTASCSCKLRRREVRRGEERRGEKRREGREEKEEKRREEKRREGKGREGKGREGKRAEQRRGREG